MEQQLAQAFNRLGPGWPLRQANLEGLFSQLSHHDVRRLQGLCALVDFRFDIVGRLPPELVATIAEHVVDNAAQLLPLLQVSGRWRMLFSNGPTRNTLARKCIPGFVEYMRLKAKMMLDHEPALDVQSAFIDAAWRTHIRHSGKFRSAFIHGLNVEGVDGNISELNDIRYSTRWFASPSNPHIPIDPHFFDPEVDDYARFTPTTFFYCHGRLAWRPEHAADLAHRSLAIVDDFRSQTRRIFSVPGLRLRGAIADIYFLGAKLIILGEDCGRVLHAWHLETNQHARISLPRGLNHFSSAWLHGETLYVHNFTQASPVQFTRPSRTLSIWKFGDQIYDIDLSFLDEQGYLKPTALERGFGIFADWAFLRPHPLVESTFFIGILPECRHKDPIVVYEFTHGKLSRVHRCPFPDCPALCSGCGRPYLDMSSYANRARLGFSNRPDSFGIWAIGKTEVLREGQPLCQDHEGVPMPVANVLCFNAITVSFFVRSFGLNHTMSGNVAHQLTHEQLLFTRSFEPGREPSPITVLSGIASQPVGSAKPLAPVYSVELPLSQGVPVTGEHMILRRTLSASGQVPSHEASFGLDTRAIRLYDQPRFRQGLVETLVDPEQRADILVADDDFIILVTGQGYIVFSYFTDMKTPILDPELPARLEEASRSSTVA